MARRPAARGSSHPGWRPKNAREPGPSGAGRGRAPIDHQPDEIAAPEAARGAFRIDAAGTRATWTPGLGRLLGLAAPGEGDLAVLQSGLCPEDRAHLAAALGAACRSEEPVALRVGLAASGRVGRIVLWAARDGEGGAVGVHGTVEVGAADAEAPLRERARALRDALDHVPHQVFVKDAQGRILLANRASAAVYGLTPEGVQGRLHAELHPVASEVERMLADDREVIASGCAKQVEEEPFRDAAGRDRLLDTVKIPFRSGGRDVVLGMAVDVTARRRALDMGARLSLALRQAVEGIALVDARGTIVFANPALARLLEMREEELVGAPFSVTSSGSEGDDSLLREIGRQVGAGEPWAGRYESRWRDGSRHVRDASVTPLRDAAGRFLGIVAVLRDVTREVELEEELHQAQKMEAVGRLAGGIAHDFNNVLTVISACAEELDEALPVGSPEREAAREIARAAERSAEIIGQLLAFSRRTPLVPEVVAPNAVVEGLASMMQRLLPASLDLELALDPDAGAVRVDRGQLERALLNLVLNARDAMPGGGRVRVETRAPAEPDGAVGITVRDEGVGMDRETRRRAFEPFFTTKGPGRGSGLGLPAVLGFARQSGGSVAVESEPGRGTAVHLRLPGAVAVPAVATGGHPPSASPGSGARVLVAEDEDAIRALVGRTLARVGYRVEVACDGREALELLEREPTVDLVLADVRMPRMDGIALRSVLSRTRPEIPVLLMSGFPGTEAREDEAEPGVLAKPFRPSALLHAVRAALARRAGPSGSQVAS